MTEEEIREKELKYMIEDSVDSSVNVPSKSTAEDVGDSDCH